MLPLSFWRALPFVLAAGLAVSSVEAAFRSLGLAPATVSLLGAVATAGLLALFGLCGARLVRWMLQPQVLLQDPDLKATLAAAWAEAAPGGLEGVDVLVVRNAAVRGFSFGTTRRGLLLVSDHAIRSLPADQLAALLAHEHGHLLRWHGVQAFVALGGLFVARSLFGGFGLPVALLMLGGYLWLLRSQELEADAHAVLAVGRPAVQSLLGVLARHAGGAAWSESRLVELLSTHPTFRRRIAMLGAAAV